MQHLHSIPNSYTPPKTPLFQYSNLLVPAMPGMVLEAKSKISLLLFRGSFLQDLNSVGHKGLVALLITLQVHFHGVPLLWD
jgi:hypothetical protein